MNAYLEYNEDAFRGGVLLLPCDDPEWSNFTKYFVQNFKRLGLKKLISTSYAPNSKPYVKDYQPGLFELESPNYDSQKNPAHGKVFTLEHDITGDGEINLADLEWKYLEGDGDFRSEEVNKLRDEATHIVTNPPFSLFREFLAWIIKDKKKKFLILGNMNAITYKEVFPLIKDNKMWLGVSSGAKSYRKPDGSEQKLGNTCWFTNLDHGRRHEPLILMSEADNLRFNKAIQVAGYARYDNYDAIEVPRTDAIPADYKGVMGVPISFLDKYNPDQFEIVALGNSRENFTPNKTYLNPKKHTKTEIISGNAINCVLAIAQKEKPEETVYYTSDNSKYLIAPYARVLIKHKPKKEKK
jgi:hypothetical protein